MELFAVFGRPIHHSLSPQMHNAAFKYSDRPAFYFPVECSPAELSYRLDAFRQLNGRGANLTRPLKELIIPHLREKTPWVEKTQAANVVAWQEDGWIGDNTDVQALVAAIPPAALSYFGGVAWVLGQGGAARASTVALQERGYDVVVFGRASTRPVWHDRWERWNYAKFLQPQCDVFVNATPIGQMGEARWPIEPQFDVHTVVVDWVYRPNITPLVEKGRQVGCTVVDGLSLLIEQAVFSWKLWFGYNGPYHVMKKAVQDFHDD